jgi:hypothetical protein
MMERARSGQDTSVKEDLDNIYTSAGDDFADAKPEDWVEIERDRRAAYTIMLSLKSEGLV